MVDNLQPDNGALGPKLGRLAPEATDALKAGDLLCVCRANTHQDGRAERRASVLKKNFARHFVGIENLWHHASAMSGPRCADRFATDSSYAGDAEQLLSAARGDGARPVAG
jgi:hypothetical protein